VDTKKVFKKVIKMISKMKKIKMLKEFYFNQKYKVPPTFKQFAEDAHFVINIEKKSMIYYYHGLKAAGCAFLFSSNKTNRQEDLLKKINQHKVLTYNDLYNIVGHTYGCKKTLHRDLVDLFSFNKIRLTTINTTFGRTSLIEKKQ
jgi:hypothetical protein